MSEDAHDAVMAYQPQDMETAWTLLNELKAIKAREGKHRAITRLSKVIAHLRQTGVPPVESYGVTHLQATSPEDLGLKFALLVIMLTKASDNGEISDADTGDIGLAVFPECTRATHRPASDFPLTLRFDLNNSCPP